MSTEADSLSLLLSKHSTVSGNFGSRMLRAANVSSRKHRR